MKLSQKPDPAQLSTIFWDRALLKIKSNYFSYRKDNLKSAFCWNSESKNSKTYYIKISGKRLGLGLTKGESKIPRHITPIWVWVFHEDIDTSRENTSQHDLLNKKPKIPNRHYTCKCLRMGRSSHYWEIKLPYNFYQEQNVSN